MDERSKSRARFDPAVFLETSAKGRVICTHRKKQIIFAQGDAADGVFYIKKGKVKVTVVSAHGKEAVVALLGIDEFLGENAGLVIAELELQAEDTQFARPPWLGVEVTHDERYYNFRLAEKPFRHWPENLQAAR